MYTYVYSNSKPRNKTQFVLQLKNKKIDYVFLGSSRVQNHINTQLVQNLTSKKAMNLGINGAKLDHIYLMLKLLVSNNVSFEKVFIQVDYIYNFDSDSKIVSPESLPFIRSNSVVNTHLKNDNPDFLKSNVIPFYRYAVNDYKIGFREFFFNVINKKSNQNFNDGFEPKNGKFKDINYKLPDTIAKKNKVLDDITQFCKTNKINLVYFCSPFCTQVSSSNFVSKLKVKIPNLYDFSNVISNDSLFVDCGHLNEKGADLFTRKLVQNCIKSSQ
jgi:hypothetical protein